MGRADNLTELEMLVLLAIMRLPERAYGVTIRQMIEERAERPTSIGAVYIALDRLEQKGLINSSLGESTRERGGRAKRLFVVNPSGKQMVRNSMGTLDRMAAGLVVVRGTT